MNKSVAIICLNWNGHTDTIAFLESIQQITYKHFDVYIIDNGSTDNSVEKIQKWIQTVGDGVFHLIIHDTNYGFAGGNNLAIETIMNDTSKQHNHDYFLLINNDTIVEENFLSHLVSLAEREQNIGMIAPLSYNFFSQEIDFYGGEVNRFLGRPYHLHTPNQQSEYTFLTGCCLLIPRDTITKLGTLFDASYFCYFEDADLSLKIRKLGKRLLLSTQSVIYHKISQSSGKKSKFYRYYFARNRIIFMKKWCPYFFYWPSFVIFHFFIKTLAILILEPRNIVVWIAGLKDGILHKDSRTVSI